MALIKAFILLLILLSASPAAARSTVVRLVDAFYQQLQQHLEGKPTQELRLGYLVTTSLPGYPTTGGQLVETVSSLCHQRLTTLFTFKEIREVSKTRQSPTTEELLALARSQGVDVVLLVELTEKDNYVALMGRLYRLNSTIWMKLRGYNDGLETHIYESIRVDAELKFLLGVTSPSTTTTHLELTPLPLPAGARVLDLAIGDVTGDNNPDLVVLLRSGISLYHLEDKKLVEVMPSLAFDDFKPAQAKSRDAVGTLVLQDLDGDGKLEVVARTSDLAYLIVATVTRGDGDNQLTGTTVGIPEFPLSCHGQDGIVTAHLKEGRNQFTPKAMVRKTRQLTAAKELPYPFDFYSAKRRPVKTAQGYLLYHGIVDSTHALHIYLGTMDSTALISLPHVGYAFEITDLEDDGRAELITSAETSPDVADRLTLYSLQRSGKELLFQREGLPAIAAISSGDVDLDGKIEVVVGTYHAGLYLLERE